MIGPAASALLAETRRKPGRVLLTGLAVLVATAFAAGTLLLGETLRAFLTADSMRTPPGAALVVLPGDTAGDPVAAARGVDGVTAAVGVWSTYLAVGGTGQGTMWEVRSDPMEGPLSRLGSPVEGSTPASADEVLVGVDTARRAGVVPGDTLTVAGDAGPRTVTVAGVVTLPGEGVNVLVARPETVEGLGGSLGQVDVAVAPGADTDTVAAGIGAAVGDAAQLRTGAEQRAAEAEDVSTSVTAVLVGVGVFAGLAVVAAAVVVASTFRIVLTQRRTQLALLRCVGARRGQVVGAVLAEAVVSGVVAGVLGVALAVGAGYGVLAVLRAGGVAQVPALVLWWPGLAGVLLVAVLATVVAALAPALAAARIPPVAALGAVGAGETGAPRTAGRLVFAGLLAAAAVALAALAFGVDGNTALAMIVVAASGIVAFAAIVAAGPVLVRGLGATVGRGVAALGRAPGRLAVANAGDVPRRTAATVSVLILGVGLTAALLVALASTQAGAERSIAEQFPADIVVSASDDAAAADLAGVLAADPRLAVRTDGPAVLVDPATGVDDDTARSAVEQAAAGRADVLVQYAADLRVDIESTLGTARLLGLGLVGMTCLVAVVGVGVTLLLSVTERTRETGLLRAVGLTRSGVRAMVAWEAALSGAGAGVVGAVVGAGYGLLGVQVLGIGTGFEAASVPPLVALVVGVVAVAVLAATVPAVRAGRVSPIAALQS